ncbi:hypothetical protein L484_002671 [Morus notabilis]|uniref:Transmembrane protein n=1 Tax=Morus notabilis TaxID=981085 RepID=W9R7T5_9ROSA|nr:hypothetical protein L484_002671 [Morus notabilis]
MASNHNYYASKSDPTFPLHLWFFLCILLMFLGLSWYTNYESMLESALDQIKLVLMMSPLVLLLVVHWHSTFDDRRRGGGGGSFSAFIPYADDRDSFHRSSGGGGGTPWGIGLLLVFLFFMISYHSSLREKWFPLLGYGVCCWWIDKRRGLTVEDWSLTPREPVCPECPVDVEKSRAQTRVEGPTHVAKPRRRDISPVKSAVSPVEDTLYHLLPLLRSGHQVVGKGG